MRTSLCACRCDFNKWNTSQIQIENYAGYQGEAWDEYKRDELRRITSIVNEYKNLWKEMYGLVQKFYRPREMELQRRVGKDLNDNWILNTDFHKMYRFGITYEGRLCEDECYPNWKSVHRCNARNRWNTLTYMECAKMGRDNYGRKCKSAPIPHYQLDHNRHWCWVSEFASATTGGKWGWTHPPFCLEESKFGMCVRGTDHFAPDVVLRQP